MEILAYLSGDLEDCDMFVRRLSKQLRTFCRNKGNMIFGLISNKVIEKKDLLMYLNSSSGQYTGEVVFTDYFGYRKCFTIETNGVQQKIFMPKMKML
jgi:hypothetical protein